MKPPFGTSFKEWAGKLHIWLAQSAAREELRKVCFFLLLHLDLIEISDQQERRQARHFKWVLRMHAFFKKRLIRNGRHRLNLSEVKKQPYTKLRN